MAETQDIDAGLLSVEWEELLRKRSPRNLQETLSEAIELYRASENQHRGAALACLIESLLDDPDGVSHPCYEHASKVIQHAKTRLDGLDTHESVLAELARSVRRLLKDKDLWINTLELAVKLIARDAGISTVARKGLEQLIKTDLDLTVVSALKRFRRLFACL